MQTTISVSAKYKKEKVSFKHLHTENSKNGGETL